MWMIRLFIAGKRPPTGPAHIAGHESRWERVRLAGDSVVHTGAHVPDGTQAAERLQKMVRSMPGVIASPDKAVTRVDAPAAPAAPLPQALSLLKPLPPEVEAKLKELDPDSPAAQKLRGALYLVDQAMGHGWVYGDITGAGEGNDPSEHGGRAEDTGLTLAELALTRPPADWAELKARGRPPWESSDWVPPGPGWKPPGWKSPPSEDAAEPPPLGPDPVIPPALDAPASIMADGVDAEPTIDAPARAPETIPPESVSELADASEGDPFGDYPEAHREEMVVIVRDLAKRQKKPPHPNAANFLLVKRRTPPLPPVDTKQIEAALKGFDYLAP